MGAAACRCTRTEPGCVVRGEAGVLTHRRLPRCVRRAGLRRGGRLRQRPCRLRHRQPRDGPRRSNHHQRGGSRVSAQSTLRDGVRRAAQGGCQERDGAHKHHARRGREDPGEQPGVVQACAAAARVASACARLCTLGCVRVGVHTSTNMDNRNNKNPSCAKRSTYDNMAPESHSQCAAATPVPRHWPTRRRRRARQNRTVSRSGCT